MNKIKYILCTFLILFCFNIMFSQTFNEHYNQKKDEYNEYINKTEKEYDQFIKEHNKNHKKH